MHRNLRLCANIADQVMPESVLAVVIIACLQTGQMAAAWQDKEGDKLGSGEPNKSLGIFGVMKQKPRGQSVTVDG